MNWRLAKSLERLRDQINAAAPARSKASDGGIGDARHAATASDHNPNAAGVVCAYDITHDPTHGVDTYALADFIRANPHPDLKFIISNFRIAGAWTNWQWARYTGSDAHTSHMHVSVGRGAEGVSQLPYDDVADWPVRPAPAIPADASAAAKTLDQLAGEVISGRWGNNPERAQRLAAAGYNPDAVQFLVNQRLGARPATPVGKSNDEVATEVIRGLWGNGQARKDALARAGYHAGTIQAIVNSRLK